MKTSRLSNLPLDGSVPDYAPGIAAAKDRFYWRPPQKDVANGYVIKSVSLEGKAGDGKDMARAARCRELERDLIRWRSDQTKPKIEPHTWGWLIRRYLQDEFSPYRDVKDNTAEEYLWWMETITTAIGEVLIEQTDYERIKRWQVAMQDKGRSVAYIARWFNRLRLAANYGALINPALCGRPREILSGMRFTAPKPRNTAPTEAQITAIIAKADAAGDAMFSLAMSLMWWTMLRPVDVLGQYLGKGDSARWADGLTWNMVSIDAATITKTPSKTEEAMPEALVWDLSPVPELIARLSAIPMEQRIGPVIRQGNGKPFHRRWFNTLYRRYAEAAGIPDHVQMRDTRAGAITDAKSKGATMIQMQHAANHANQATTHRYVRDKGAEVAEVIMLRRTNHQP